MVAIVAHQVVFIAMVSQRYAAVRAWDRFAAGRTKHEGRETAAVQEQHGLLSFRERVEQSFAQRLRDQALLAELGKILLKVHDLDVG